MKHSFEWDVLPAGKRYGAEQVPAGHVALHFAAGVEMHTIVQTRAQMLAMLEKMSAAVKKA